MFVASQDGIETLDLEFVDPLVCTYKTDGALDAQEMQNYRNKGRNKHGCEPKNRTSFPRFVG